MFSAKISKKQSSDAGMAAVLILLLIGVFTSNVVFYKIAIPALLINMAVPMFYYPFAIIWFGLSDVLGTVFSKIIITVIYVVLVLPIGLIRKMAGKDPMLIRQFKKNSSSVFKSRNIVFSSKDIEVPY